MNRKSFLKTLIAPLVALLIPIQFRKASEPVVDMVYAWRHFISGIYGEEYMEGEYYGPEGVEIGSAIWTGDPFSDHLIHVEGADGERYRVRNLMISRELDAR